MQQKQTPQHRVEQDVVCRNSAAFGSQPHHGSTTPGCSIPQIIVSHTGRRDQPYLGPVVETTFLQNLPGHAEVRVDSLNNYFLC